MVVNIQYLMRLLSNISYKDTELWGFWQIFNTQKGKNGMSYWGKGGLR